MAHPNANACEDNTGADAPVLSLHNKGLSGRSRVARLGSRSPPRNGPRRHRPPDVHAAMLATQQQGGIGLGDGESQVAPPPTRIRQPDSTPPKLHSTSQRHSYAASTSNRFLSKRRDSRDRESTAARLPMVAELTVPGLLGAEGRSCWEHTTAGDSRTRLSIALVRCRARGHVLRVRTVSWPSSQMKGPGPGDTDKNLSIRVAEASRELSARVAKLG
jgi:hypothetical protein